MTTDQTPFVSSEVEKRWIALWGTGFSTSLEANGIWGGTADPKVEAA